MKDKENVRISQMYRDKRLESNSIYKRDQHIHFRLTHEEKDRIKALADKSNQTVTSFLVSATLSPTTIVLETDDLHEFSYQISKLNNNLNQISRAISVLSTTKGVDSTIVQKLTKKLDACYKMKDLLLDANIALYEELNKTIKNLNKQEDE